MLFDWIGEETAFAGLHLYLTRHAFSNTVTEDVSVATRASTRG